VPENTRHLRVAVLIAGALEGTGWKECIDSIKRYVVSPYNSDVFVVADATDKNASKVVRYINPKLYILGDYTSKEVHDRLKSAFTTNFYRMLSKMHDCNELRRQFERDHRVAYDVVVVMRPDLMLYEPMNIGVCLASPQCVFCAKKREAYLNGYSLYGFTDQCFFASPKVMNKLLVGTQEFTRKLSHTDIVPICRMNEYIIYRYCLLNGICIRPFPLYFCILRHCNLSNLQWVQDTLQKKGSLVSASKEVCDRWFA